jgi:hypothetical protein
MNEFRTGMSLKKAVNLISGPKRKIHPGQKVVVTIGTVLQSCMKQPQLGMNHMGAAPGNVSTGDEVDVGMADSIQNQRFIEILSMLVHVNEQIMLRMIQKRT